MMMLLLPNWPRGCGADDAHPSSVIHHHFHHPFLIRVYGLDNQRERVDDELPKLFELFIGHSRSYHGHSWSIIDDIVPSWMKTERILITLMLIDE